MRTHPKKQEKKIKKLGKSTEKFLKAIRGDKQKQTLTKPQRIRIKFLIIKKCKT